jgi:hypothetical protein
MGLTAAKSDVAVRPHGDKSVTRPAADAVDGHVGPEESCVDGFGVALQQDVQPWSGGQLVQADSLPVVRHVLVR